MRNPVGFLTLVEFCSSQNCMLYSQIWATVLLFVFLAIFVSFVFIDFEFCLGFVLGCHCDYFSPRPRPEHLDFVVVFMAFRGLGPRGGFPEGLVLFSVVFLVGFGSSFGGSWTGPEMEPRAIKKYTQKANRILKVFGLILVPKASLRSDIFLTIFGAELCSLAKHLHFASLPFFWRV